MRNKYSAIVTGIFFLLGLYLTSLYSFLLFHTVVELFSILIAFCIFVIVWNSEQFLGNSYLRFLGIAYLFVGIIDLLHTLAYKGMGVFIGYDANLPTQLWICGRYVQSLSLLIAPFCLGRKPKMPHLLAGYGAATFLMLWAIFGGVFPDCFIEGVGLTPFKKMSEYIISLILLASLVLLTRKQKEFERDVLQFLLLSILLTIGSELAFTFYISVYGFSNLIGHFFKIAAFYLVYKALVETGLKRPYGLLFRDLKQREEELGKAKEELEMKVAERTGELKITNEQLQLELAERRRTADVLRKSVEEIHDLYNRAPCGYHSIDKDGLFIRVNDTELQWLGYTRKEVIGRIKFSDLLTPKSRERFQKNFSRFKAEGKARDVEYELIRKDGVILPVLLNATAVKDSEGNYLMSRSTMYDIAERKQAEKVLRESEKQLRYLSSQLLTAQEMERKSIAREIHDSLGQSLSLIKFRIEGFLMEMRERGTKEGAEKLESLIPIIQGSIEEARRIQTGLRPSMLDDLGILATLSWFCREFEKTYADIRIDKEVDIEEDEIPDPLKTTMYRVMQEAMNNIAKHSKANLVRLSLTAADGRIELMIQDNGHGFDLEKALSAGSSRKGFGLTSMTERAELSGGFIAIESGKGAGTIIRIAWPIETSAAG